MLRSLKVSNYTIMSRVEVDFQPGLNVITGETGAGKSLLLDAVSSLLGEKRSGVPIRAGANQAVIEAEFDSRQPHLLQDWLKNHDLPPDLPILLRREFHQSGRTRVFLNDSATTLNRVGEVGNMLLDFHGQHEVVTLFDRARQLELLDAFAQQPEALNRYRALFGALRKAREQLRALTEKIEDSSAGREALSRQKEELDLLDPKPDEIAALETELQRLENAERIYQVCSQICDLLNEAPSSAVEHLAEISELLPELLPYYESLKGWEDELKNVRSILIELNHTLQEYSRELLYDPQHVENLRLRVTALTGFQKRWNWGNRDLCSVCEEIDRRIADLNELSGRARDFRAQIENDERELVELGKQISESRQAAAVRLAVRVHQKLANIGMEKAKFKVVFDPPHTEQPYGDGLDRIEFVLTPDGKIPHQPLRQVASGGEMSRILLALKSSLAEVDRTETLIFDEIDQGISGRVARMVGLQLLELARNHQVIVVTHLPQIASLGDLHLSVRPCGEDGSAVVHKLDDEKRLEELAALLTATGLSDGALLNAREMLDSAQRLKSAS